MYIVRNFCVKQWYAIFEVYCQLWNRYIDNKKAGNNVSFSGQAMTNTKKQLSRQKSQVSRGTPSETELASMEIAVQIDSYCRCWVKSQLFWLNSTKFHRRRCFFFHNNFPAFSYRYCCCLFLQSWIQYVRDFILFFFFPFSAVPLNTLWIFVSAILRDFFICLPIAF